MFGSWCWVQVVFKMQMEPLFMHINCKQTYLRWDWLYFSCNGFFCNYPSKTTFPIFTLLPCSAFFKHATNYRIVCFETFCFVINGKNSLMCQQCSSKYWLALLTYFDMEKITQLSIPQPRLTCIFYQLALKISFFAVQCIMVRGDPMSFGWDSSKTNWRTFAQSF